MTKWFCAMALAVLSVDAAQAADVCKAIALRDVAAIESPSSMLAKGQYDTAVTQYRVETATGDDSICSHGGYCYPMHVTIGGKRVEALRLTNCKPGTKAYAFEEGMKTYELDVIRSAVPARDLRYDDLDNKLLSMGLCSACAGNVAMMYLERPQSKCAAVTRKALEGDPAALEALQGDPGFCTYRR
ncbi:hypothetical protein [Lichenibacterium ramalinae]|uniref:Uncharacterized protein n=1 Tax=Lichenibacterium ramalinae TaxID=2316527 RepID=A0A4Q2R8K6_9HYPH|nr:hypothetical protein [Lichenibacterium ramalinae]RYB02113.1 hypothetical protein D3272_22595 [Lichenibacterium ramalinae]